MSYPICADTIRSWFDDAQVATGPVFPDGWFGRPYDSQYMLQSVDVTPEHLRVVFRCGRFLHFEGPLSVTNLGRGLMFVGFSRCVFADRDFQSPDRVLAEHRGGVALLVAGPH